MKKNDDPNYSAAWITGHTTHEGAPIALRIRPNANTPTNRKRYNRRVAVVHELAEVTQNGMPEAEYNEGLAAFDHEMHQCLEGDGDGLVVLVETLSGRRIYFSYVRPGIDVDARLDALKAKYPQHALRSKAAEDTEWEAYEHYHKLFPW
jgi:Family of unknown function (DUF695)